MVEPGSPLQRILYAYSFDTLRLKALSFQGLIPLAVAHKKSSYSIDISHQEVEVEEALVSHATLN
jgi:hypothetical protein